MVTALFKDLLSLRWEVFLFYLFVPLLDGITYATLNTSRLVAPTCSRACHDYKRVNLGYKLSALNPIGSERGTLRLYPTSRRL